MLEDLNIEEERSLRLVLAVSCVTPYMKWHALVKSRPGLIANYGHTTQDNARFHTVHRHRCGLLSGVATASCQRWHFSAHVHRNITQRLTQGLDRHFIHCCVSSPGARRGRGVNILISFLEHFVLLYACYSLMNDKPATYKHKYPTAQLLCQTIFKFWLIIWFYLIFCETRQTSKIFHWWRCWCCWRAKAETYYWAR